MKKMTKFVLIAMLLVTLLSACGQKATDEATINEATTDEKEPQDLVFASVVKSSGDTWFIRYETGIEQFETDYGVKSFMEGPSQPDSAAQVALIEDLIAQNVDVIINVPYGVAENELAQKKAMDAGIIVIGHEAETANEGTLNYDVEAFDNCSYGEEMMRELAERMGEEGKYIQFVGSLTNASHNQWTECARQYQEANYPDMEFVAKYESKENQENAYNIMKDVLKTYPDIKGVEGSDSGDILGAGRAIEEAGLADQIVVVGTGIASDAKELLKTGAVDLAMAWDPGMAGYACSVIAYKMLQGEEIVEGLDLNVPGFESIRIGTGPNGIPVIYGSAWIKITVETMDQYPF
ncbi:MAG TPA: LacI family transcriptional regulator [Anaerolineaceae bacterium]|nr:LacI family transcriptional regulator [Anaerolineaceae bacterium]